MSDRIYCYPNSNVLKNQCNITDKQELLEIETHITYLRLIELQKTPIKGNFDFDHLKKIHKYIFQDLYTWAGKTRTVNIGKGNLFCLTQFIDSYAASIFETFVQDCIDVKTDHDAFVRTLTKHYADMNALHPFREGNGRTQREFTRELCMHCDYIFDLTKTNHKQMLQASIASFDSNDRSMLEKIFMESVTPIHE